MWAETYDCCGGGNGARTAKDGTYTLNGLASGDYRVQVFVPEEGLAGEFYDDTGDWSKAARVEVSSGATTQNIDFSLGTGGSISGTVYQENGTTPLANADVWANTYECCGGGNGTRTDSDGTYSIDGLASGDYRVEAFAGGEGYAHEFFDETTDWNEASRVEVTGGDTTSGIDFTLDAGGTISGTVYEADGETPVADADVWADSDECCGGGNGARTATDGTYTISGLAAGDYRVQTHARDGGLVGEFYDDTTDWGQADSVTVTAGQDTSGIDFTLASGGSISGTVVRDSDGSGVADVDVWANSYDCCGGSGTRTDEDGAYTITGLASGEFRVEVYAAGHGLAGEFYDDEGNWDDADSVTVTVGQTTTGINFSLASGGTISGTVYAADGTTPVSGANLWANGYDDEGGHGWTNSESDGTYTISGLSAGEYRVEVEADDLVHKIYDGTTQWHLATPVSVLEGQDTSGIDFTLETGGIISGTVYEGNGTTPLPGVHVSASSYDGDGGWGWAETAQDGTYVMNGLATGDYRVQVDAGHKGFARQYYDDTTDWNLADRVSVTSGSTKPNINFSLSAGGSISGTVLRDSDGSPVDDADVWADSYECCGEGNGTRTASDGTFTISGLGAGDYRVQVRVDDDDEDLASEFYNDTGEWSDADRVTVVADQTTSSIDFSLATGGSITGTVVSAADGTPIEDADVWADTYDCCGGGNWARTDEDGTYTISGLAEGEYRVQVDARGEGVVREYFDDTQDWGQADPVTVVAGQATSDVDFSLEAGGSISGTVYEADGATPVANADVWADTYDCCAGGAWARTESDGTYLLSGLAADDYRVQVQVPDEGLVPEFYDDITSWDEADRVSVVAGQTTSDIDFSLGSGGSIFGTVYESDGITLVSGADVSAEGQTGGWGHSRSAADGTYNIQGLPSGDYVVRAEALDQSLAAQFYDGESDWGLATLVSVTVGEVVPLIDFQLDTGGSVSGTVYESDGTTAIANADIWANRTIGGGGWGRTSSDGTYTILGLAAGDYRVEASAREQGFASEFYDGETNWDSATLVAVTSGSEASGVDFTLEAGGTISGTVYLADGATPVAHADVWADTYVCCAGGNGTRTDSDGTYQIEGLGAGDYRVQARAPEQGLVGKFYDDTTDWSLATEVTVASGQDTPDIDFALGAGGSVTGTVVLESDGSPVVGADVWANTYECCAGGNGARTAADGTYEISGLASGDYRVEVRADDQGLVGEFYDDTTDWSGADQVTVASGQATAGIDFTLEAGGSISGTVYEADGTTPIAGAEVFAEREGLGEFDAETGENGGYVIDGLPAGSYLVEAVADGFIFEIYSETQDEEAATLVAVTVGQETQDIDFTLEPGGAIAGTVFESDGQTPIEGAFVIAQGFGEPWPLLDEGFHEETESDGTYVIDGSRTASIACSPLPATRASPTSFTKTRRTLKRLPE